LIGKSLLVFLLGLSGIFVEIVSSSSILVSPVAAIPVSFPISVTPIVATAAASFFVALESRNVISDVVVERNVVQLLIGRRRVFAVIVAMGGGQVSELLLLLFLVARPGSEV
jgi:hypothetical protein